MSYATRALEQYANTSSLMVEMRNNSVPFEELQTIFNSISNAVYDSHVYAGGYRYTGFHDNKVWGIVTGTPKATLEIAARHGIVGGSYDKLGYDYIVYWVDYEYKPD